MIKIIGVGAIKENYIRTAIDSLQTAIGQKQKIEIISVEDEKCPENLSDKEKIEVKRREGDKILRHIKAEDYVIALTLEGKSLSRDRLSKDLRRETTCFLIGGSLGLSPEVRKRANAEISFGPMTYPHQLMRWILLEQIEAAL